MKKGLVGVGIVAVLAACGVPKEKYTSLQDQMKGCEGTVSSLKGQLDSGTEEKTKCESDRAALSAQKSELETNLAALSTKKTELETKTKTYEDLVSSLEGEIKTGKVKISEMRGRLSVNLIDKILFDSGSTIIKEEGKETLKKIGDVLKDVKDRRIQVEGHTDDVMLGAGLRRKFPTNWELSTARATVVVRHLEELGVDPVNLSAAGYSRFAPVVPNDSPEGRRQNRRIEIVLMPKLAVQTTEPEAK